MADRLLKPKRKTKPVWMNNFVITPKMTEIQLYDMEKDRRLAQVRKKLTQLGR